MKLEQLQRDWDAFGERDPFWAILSGPGKRGGRWNPKAFFGTGEQEIADLFSRLSSRLIEVNFGTALDFGCGVGRLTQALARRFKKVHGVDIAPSMIARAEAFNQFPQSCFYYCQPADDLRLFPDASFEFLYSVLTLQHIPPTAVRNYLKEFMRVLKPGGLAVFQLPSQPARSLRATVSRWRMGLRSILDRLRGAPVMEIHGLPTEVVEKLLDQHQGWVISADQDDRAGPGWTSCTYVVRKRHSPGRKSR